MSIEAAPPTKTPVVWVNIRVSTRTHKLLRQAAGLRALAISDYISEVVDPTVEADLIKHARQIGLDGFKG